MRSGVASPPLPSFGVSNLAGANPEPDLFMHNQKNSADLDLTRLPNEIVLR